MQHVLDETTTLPEGLSAAEVARRAGINRTTLHRIAIGAVDPTFATLRELAIVHGLEIDIRLRPLSDPDAATAARYLLDPRFGELPLTGPVERWVERLDRVERDRDNSLLVLRTAGRAASLLHREDAVFLRGGSSARRLASAGDASDGFWALSGKAAFAIGDGATVRGPAVLWVDDVQRAALLLSDTHRRVTSANNAQVIVAPANPSIPIDAHIEDGIRYVAPIQMLLDGIGLGGELAGQAELIAQEWSR